MEVNLRHWDETFVSRVTLRAASLDQLRLSSSGRSVCCEAWSLATPTPTIPVVMKEGVVDMPRQADPGNELGRRATERWRAGLRAAAQPEACHVDTALAAAVAVYVARVQAAGGDIPAPIKALVEDAVRILESRGYDPVESKRKSVGRLLYRRDRETLRRSVEQSASRRSLS